MAGRVLRSSNGRFAGSTKGWMAGVRKGSGRLVHRNPLGSKVVMRNADGSSTVYRVKLNADQKRYIRSVTILGSGVGAAGGGLVLGVGGMVSGGIWGARRTRAGAQDVIVRSIQKSKNPSQTLTFVKQKKAPGKIKKVARSVGYTALAVGIDTVISKQGRMLAGGAITRGRLAYRKRQNERQAAKFNKAWTRAYESSQKLANLRRASARGLASSLTVSKYSRRRGYKITTLKGRRF